MMRGRGERGAGDSKKGRERREEGTEERPVGHACDFGDLQ